MIHSCLCIMGMFFLCFSVEEGSLSVSTDPEGVEVWLGDKYIGDSPIVNRKLKGGRYLLKLVDPVQQVSSTEEIFIQDGKNTVIETSLKTKFGTLKVESEPTGSEVHLYSMLGKTPLENNFMNPGKYLIEIRHKNQRYIPAISEVTIPQGRKVEITNVLAKKSLMNPLAFARIMLGGVCAGGYIWALIEQGLYKEAQTSMVYIGENSVNYPLQKKRRNRAALYRTCGIVIGSVSMVSLQIVAFF
ncbi:MAG: PEGA domain-containing protein [Chitinivibrionales bacterium]|nr:PEGA domain-containing protein [Chitinivibrionales bacterium]